MTQENQEIPKKEKNYNKTGRYTDIELLYIKINYENKTDKEIAEYLGRPETGIKDQRDKMGLKKSIGRPKNQKPKLTSEDYYASPDNANIMRDLTPQERKQFAIQLFQNSTDYKRLKKQFTDDEIQVYVDLFSDYLSEFQQLLPQEVQQVHILVKEQLIQDRFLQRIKLSDTLKIKIQELQAQKTVLFLKSDKTAEDNQELENITTIIDDVKMNMEIAENIWKEFNESAMRFDRAMKALKFTREQRLKNQQELGITLVSVARKLNDAKVREAEGRHAAMLNKQMEQFKDQAKDKGFFMGEF